MIKISIKMILIGLICLFSLAFYYYQSSHALGVEEVDFYSFVTESMITFVVFLIILNLQSHHHKNISYLLINLGFSFLFVALFADTLDELYQVSKLTTRWFEDTFQVLGFVLLLLGVRAWRKDNQTQTEYLNQLAATDDLTGLYLRRHFHTVLNNAFHQVNEKTRLAILMIDIDHFKQINDVFGHLQGDQVLKQFSQQLLNCVGIKDNLARWGGEEFIVMYDQNTHLSPDSMAEEIRLMAESLIIMDKGQRIHFSVSIGISQYRETDNNLDSLIDRADKCLYRAKKAGRNCIESDQMQTTP